MADEKSIDVKVSIPQQMRDVDVLQLMRPPTKVPALLGTTKTLESIASMLEQVKQVLETREGTRGSWVEKSVTWRDLFGTGLAKFSVDGIIYNPGGGGGGGGGVLPPTNPGDVPVYTAPPAPTGVSASGAMTMVIVEWDVPNYSYHGYAEIWRADSNLLANAVLIGTSSSSLFADEIGPGLNRYYWVRFVNKWDNSIKGPYQGTDGVLATTGVDVDYLLEQLEGQITQTHLDAALSSEIDQIDVLAIEVSQLSAGVAGAFDAFETYYFDLNAEGWVADTDASVSHSGGHLIVNSTGTTPSVKLNVDLSPGITGANYPVVKARVKRVSGSTWSGKLQWKTSGHGFSGSYQKVISDPSIAIGDYATLEWDMSADTDYNSSTILNLRLEIGAASDDDFDIDWIATGRNAPGASVAMVGEETTARVAADAVEISHRELLAAKIIGTTDPDDIDNLADLSAGLIYEEKSVRISEDSAIVQSVQTLSTTVDDNTTAIQIAASSIDGLEAQYTVKIDNNGNISGFGLASENPTGEPGGAISTFGVRADTFYIANPTGPSIPSSMPFIVKTTSWVSAGGITNPPGVYMRSVYIADGEIVNAKIGNLAVDDAKIANLSAVKLTAGEIHADRLNANTITGKVLSVDVAKLTTGIVGGTIYSQSFAPDVGGWALYQNGYAELNNIKVRGQINGGSFTGYAWPSAGNYGFHLGPNGLLLGNANNNKYVQITYDGQFYAPGLTIINGSASFSGTVNSSVLNSPTINSAAIYSAYISGGSINGTTGTFGGLVTGNAVVDTLQLAGESVIIPRSAENINVFYGNATWQDILGMSITLPAYTKLHMTFSLSMWTQNFSPPEDWPLVWAFRILRHDGSPIYYTGPAVYGGNWTGLNVQPSVTFSRQWAEEAGTWNFGVQFYGLNQNVVAAYPFGQIMATKR